MWSKNTFHFFPGFFLLFCGFFLFTFGRAFNSAEQNWKLTDCSVRCWSALSFTNNRHRQSTLSTKIVWKMKNSRNWCEIQCDRRISLTWSSVRMLRTQKEQSRIQKNKREVLQIITLFLNWLETFRKPLEDILPDLVGRATRYNFSREFFSPLPYLLDKSWIWILTQVWDTYVSTYLVNALAFILSLKAKACWILTTWNPSLLFKIKLLDTIM